jgi:hypothetical protein
MHQSVGVGWLSGLRVGVLIGRFAVPLGLEPATHFPEKRRDGTEGGVNSGVFQSDSQIAVDCCGREWITLKKNISDWPQISRMAKKMAIFYGLNVLLPNDLRRAATESRRHRLDVLDGRSIILVVGRRF